MKTPLLPGRPPCRLCLKHAELRDSHILPKWTYRLLRAPSLPNPNPVLMDGEHAVQTNLQAKEELLCPDCEQDIGRTENHVRGLVYSDEQPAPVFGREQAQVETHAGSGSFHPKTLLLDVRDASALARFAISVIWRSHSAQGDIGGQVELGQRWGEHLRRVLIREEPLSPHVTVLLSVLDPGDLGSVPYRSAAMVPASSQDERFFRHEFLVCGFAFYLFISRNPSAQAAAKLSDLCLVRSKEKRALVVGADRLGAARIIEKMIEKSRPAPKLRKSLDASVRRS